MPKCRRRPRSVGAAWRRPFGRMPWLVHPNIVARVIGATRDGSPDHAVMFGPWSVLLDQAALAVIAAAAVQANQRPEATVTLAG